MAYPIDKYLCTKNKEQKIRKWINRKKNSLTSPTHTFSRVRNRSSKTWILLERFRLGSNTKIGFLEGKSLKSIKNLEISHKLNFSNQKITEWIERI